jgi:ribosomal protein S27E
MSDVVELKTKRKPRPTGNFLEIVYGSLCRHKHVLIDEKKAEVECADCNAKLDPIQVLMALCKEEHDMWRRYLYAKAAIKEITGRTKFKCKHCGRMTELHSNLSQWDLRVSAEDVERQERERNGGGA